MGTQAPRWTPGSLSTANPSRLLYFPAIRCLVETAFPRPREPHSENACGMGEPALSQPYPCLVPPLNAWESEASGRPWELADAPPPGDHRQPIPMAASRESGGQVAVLCATHQNTWRADEGCGSDSPTQEGSEASHSTSRPLTGFSGDAPRPVTTGDQRETHNAAGSPATYPGAASRPGVPCLLPGSSPKDVLSRM